MSSNFQTAVKKSVSREKRQEAIDRLAETGNVTKLSVLVQMGGLAGEFRRQALEALVDNRATEELESLADDPSIEPSLRQRAAEDV